MIWFSFSIIEKLFHYLCLYLHDDDNFFKQLMEKVFFPTGFDITAFSSLIKSKKMTSFSIQNVSQFAFEISI